MKKRMRCTCRLSYFVFVPQRASLAPLWPLGAPTWTVSLLLVDGEPFSFFSFLTRWAFFLPTFFSFLWAFLNIYENVVIERLPQTQHSKAQPIRARQRKQTDRVGERQHIVEHLYSSLRSQKRRNQNLPSKTISTTAHKAAEADMMREDSPLFPISIIYSSAHSLRPFYIFCTCMRRPGCFPGEWSSWIFASRQFAPKIGDFSDRFIRILFGSESSIFVTWRAAHLESC